MSLNPRSVVLLLVWCLFMGVTAISIGVGAIFPALNQIAGPFICASGSMQVNSQTYYPQPGQTVTLLDWQCVDKRTGEAQPVNELSMFLINGLIYGLILFAVILIGQQILARRRARSTSDQMSDNVFTALENHQTVRAVTSFDIPESEELRKLLSLRDAGLITEQDYEQRKAEILRRL